MLTFYKPNKFNKGSLISINFSAKADKIDGDKSVKGDKSFYFNLVGQTGWNEETKNGTFKDGKKIVVKLSPTEVAGLIAAIKRNTSLAKVMNIEYIYHDGDKTATIIYFEPHFKKEQKGDKWVDTTNQVGFGLRVVKTEKANKENKEQLSIGFTYAETELLVNYLKDGLSHIFNALFSEDVSRPKKEVEKPKVETKVEAQPEQVDSLPQDDGALVF